MFARVIDLFWGIFPRSLLVIQGLKNALLALSLQKPFLDGSLPVHLVAFVSKGGGITSQVPPMEKKEFDLPPPVSQKREAKHSRFLCTTTFKQQKLFEYFSPTHYFLTTFSSSFFSSADPYLTNVKRKKRPEARNLHPVRLHITFPQKNVKKTRNFEKMLK